MHDAITTVIPGARKSQQVVSNVTAAAIPDLPPAQMAGVQKIYDQYIRAQVHQNW